jgi:zinc protease
MRTATHMTRHALVAMLSLGLVAGRASGQEIPERPEALSFEPIVFDPPSPEDHRHVLDNGMVVFIAEDKALPLVSISITFKAGSWLDPAGQEGLASLTGSQMRRGGTMALSGEELDERLDFLAAQVSTGLGPVSGGASLSCLADNLDEAFPLFLDVLREPRFQQDRLDLAREQALQSMKKRNDDSANIEAREWTVLLYGEDHNSNRFTTEASLGAIARDDLVAFHGKFVHPQNMIAAVSGYLDTDEMLTRLEKAFADWPGKATALPPIPDTIHPAEPGLYRIQKDVNQGRVSMGLPMVRRGHPDVYALKVMNDILGAPGLTSRLMTTVRSNEGLAYSAGSGLFVGVFYPGRFRASFQSKSPTVLRATELVQDEIRRMREETVTAQELEIVKSSLIQTFPSSFGTKGQAMGIFASDEYTGRDPSFWKTYRSKIQDVSVEDIQRVARTHLVPEKMILLIVGDQAAIDADAGDPAHEVTAVSLAPGGRVVELPLRDPMTMKAP